MKIAIVGCGLAGMSSYLALAKHLPGEHQVTIYESRQTWPGPPAEKRNDPSADADAPQGGAIGLSANGMRVLRNLDPGVHEAMRQRGFAYDTLKLRSSSGWDLSVVSKRERADDVTVIAARQTAWQVLRDAVPEGRVVGRKVVGVARRGRREGNARRGRREGNARPVVLFADGAGEEFDLVVGADGVHSTVRRALFGDDTFDSSAVFSKRCGIWGFIPVPIPEEVTGTRSVVIVLGDCGSVGYSAYRPTEDDSLTWWSLYETEEAPGKKDVSPELVSQVLREKYGHWEERNVRTVLETASAPFIYPIWTVPELPTWGDGGIVLLGDAAHAMTPDTGQGTSQAFEDAEALGMLLGRALRAGMAPEDAVDVTVKGLYETRAPRLARIKLLNAEAQAKGVKRSAWVQRIIFFVVWMAPKLTWLRDVVYGGGHKTDEILYGWDVEEETRKVMERHGGNLGGAREA